MSSSSARVPNKAGSGNGWRQDAACADMDAELFFPIGTTGTALLQVEDAKLVCRRCPVVRSCLEWALTVGEVGVWGGTSEEERKALKRRLQRRDLRAKAKAEVS